MVYEHKPYPAPGAQSYTRSTLRSPYRVWPVCLPQRSTPLLVHQSWSLRCIRRHGAGKVLTERTPRYAGEILGGGSCFAGQVRPLKDYGRGGQPRGPTAEKLRVPRLTPPSSSSTPSRENCCAMTVVK